MTGANKPQKILGFTILQPPMAQPYGSSNDEGKHRSPEDDNDRYIHRRKKRAPGIPDVKWNTLKGIIYELYDLHNGVLKDIMAEMSQSHDFRPT